MHELPETDQGSSFYRASWATIILTLAWGASLTIARELLTAEPGLTAALRWGLAVIPLLLGLALLRSYMRWMKTLDELWISIYLRSLAFSFGFCVLGLLCYPLLAFSAAPALDPFIYGAVNVLVFGLATFYNARKYA